MSSPSTRERISPVVKMIGERLRLRFMPALPLTIALSVLVGLAGGYGSVLFSLLIEAVSSTTVMPLVNRAEENFGYKLLLCAVPAGGLLFVSWFTRRFAPEAQGHGVPEVITAVARHDGRIRPQVAIVKILASGFSIGTGGSVGREGPIVQIGATVGSVAGQWFKLSARNIKVLVAAGAAAGISATFNAPIAGVIFASEIILGSFAVESMTPIVIASVIADVVQQNVGEHGLAAAFPHLLDYSFEGTWSQLPTYLVLGLMSGLAAVSFTKVLYYIEDLTARLLPRWWLRALVLGLIVGLAAFYPVLPGGLSQAEEEKFAHERPPPALFGVGYDTVEHALHMKSAERRPSDGQDASGVPHNSNGVAPNGVANQRQTVELDRPAMWRTLWWLLPLVFLKPIMTSLTLAGGGSGGVFAPSLFLGATLGGAFGLLCNLFIPGISANPGVYAIVGMAAVVAGTTHGLLSAILIVYEMTGNYRLILPIMAAAGLASVVASLIDRESIYYKKLSRRGETIARGHDMNWAEHVMVRDVMVRDFPTVKHTDDLAEIVRVARANPHFETLPVMLDDGKLLGIIRPEDLHRVLDTDISPHVLNAGDIALTTPVAVSPDENLLEALRDFGTRDVESLPVEMGQGENRRLIGLLLRSEVMSRVRSEMLKLN